MLTALGSFSHVRGNGDEDVQLTVSLLLLCEQQDLMRFVEGVVAVFGFAVYLLRL